MSIAVPEFQPSAEPCPHCWDDSAVVKPTLSSKVYKDECVYCFTSNDEGIFVCLKCFLGMCGEHMKYHDRCGHALFMYVKKLPKPEKPTEEITTLAQLGMEPPDEFETTVVCRPCTMSFPMGAGVTEDSTKGVMGALSPQLQATIAEQNQNSFTKACPHAEAIVQPEERLHKPGNPPRENETCGSCPHTQNNWICLTCGNIGCPREEAGGKQHAILHHMMTGHSVVVKSGTITPAGADLYCYACNDDVRDSKLREHLGGLGIDMNTAVKTAKSMAELQLDQTAKFDFGKISEAGKDLAPRHGPGFTGFVNLGNSCYLGSVLQALFTIPEFKHRFFEDPSLQNHQEQCTQNPPDCYQCQLQKLGRGFFSGEYSALDLPKYKNGIRPRDFKTFITKGHTDFSTGEQQDAEEFLRYLLQTLSRKELALSSNPTLAQDPSKLFEFLSEERSQCSKCHGVRYQRHTSTALSFNIPVQPPTDPSAKVEDENRPKVSLDDCLSHFLFPSEMDCRCEGCKESSTYHQTTRVATFPEVFALHPRREYLDKTVLTTRKLDVFVEAPEEIDLGRIRGAGLQSGEIALPAASATCAPSPAGGIEVDEIGLATLLSMGIELEPAKWALQNTNNDAERAVDWVFSHPEGPPSGGEPAGGQQQQPQALPPDPVVATDGGTKYELFAMVSHIGASALTGHYIAHVKKEGKWTICNDEKVAFSQDPPFSMASIYFYRRKSPQ